MITNHIYFFKQDEYAEVMPHTTKEIQDMTKGGIYSSLILFALPILLGQIFQQLYNTFDTWCVGNFVGKNSFSAVGTVGSIVNMLIGFAGGFATGASVVISQYFGAGDKENVSKAVHTFFVFFIIISIAVTILGLLLVPFFLDIVKAPEEVRVEQEIYLYIYFAGVSGLLIYNMGSAIFRAVGNSRLPFIFLVVSAVLNIIMDLIFVIFFKMGTSGVAIATIIAQAISAFLVLLFLFRTNSDVRLSLSKLCLDKKILKSIVLIGLPSAIQMSITAFSNVFVQSYINYFGSDVMGGWTAYTKVDQLLFLPMQSLGLASMTFVGQNIGAKQIKRAQKGANRALILGLLSTIFFLLPIIIFSPYVVEFFISKDEVEVIKYGSLFLRVISPFYIVCTFNQVYGSALRGAGNSQLPMAIMLFSFVIARQCYLFIMKNFISNTVLPIAMGYPFGWILCSVLITITYLLYFRKLKKKASLLSLS